WCPLRGAAWGRIPVPREGRPSDGLPAAAQSDGESPDAWNAHSITEPSRALPSAGSGTMPKGMEKSGQDAEACFEGRVRKRESCVLRRKECRTSRLAGSKEAARNKSES